MQLLGLTDEMRAAERDDKRLRAIAAQQRGYAVNSPRVRKQNKDFFWDMGQSQLPHVYRSLRMLRMASRKLAKTNGYFIKFLRMCRRNVIGPNGMRIQTQAYTPRGDRLDAPLNALLDEHWKRWSHPDMASANGRLSWLDLQLKWITMLARDGEVLIRKIPADNAYGFSLKILDPAWLDETYNEVRPGGNRIIMSVEIDGNDRPVAYWLTPPGDAYYAGVRPTIERRMRVPAEFVYHHFLPFDQNCGDDTVTRGVPWAHSAMLKLWMLGAFEEAAIIAARLGASKQGFLKKQKDELGISTANPLAFLPQTTNGDEENATNGPQLPSVVNPGQIDIIDDYEFQSVDWQYPSDLVKPFNSAMLHGVAADLGPEYFSFASDLTEVNFSAGRIGLEEERDHWRGIQGFGREHLVRPVRLDWQKSGMLAGAIAIDLNQLERLSEPKITPRGYGYYDPLKDVQTDEKRLALGLTSRKRILADQGDDEFEEIMEELDDENAVAAEYEMDIAPAKAGAGSQAAGAGEEKPANANDPNGDTAN